MTTDVDVCNMALSEIGSQELITAIGESTPAGRQSELYYTRMRQQLLRTAPWGFARRTVTLTETGTLAEETSPYPWLFKYEHPEDCQKFRYVLPPPFPPSGESVPDVSSGSLFPWCAPSREFRFLIALDVTTSGEPPATVQSKVIISNLEDALGVYTADVEDPDLWDSLFTNALTMTLASKFVMPLTGNVGLKREYEAMAQAAIVQARAVDGNESISVNEHVPDWIAVRGLPAAYGTGVASGWGQWLGAYDNMSWSM